MLYEGDEEMSDVKRERFISTLTSAYNQDGYVLFLKELLVNIQIVAPNKDVKPWNTFSAAVDHYNHIGNYVGNDGKKVALFSVCLKNDKNIENARSMQRGFVKSLLESSDCAGALVSFFTTEEPDKWRLSLVRMDYEFSKGRISTNLTPAKRYSYLVGKGEPSHTAQERLYPIFVNDNSNPGLDDLEDAFSVEAVTKDFFDKYREKYLDLKESLEGNSQFVAEAKSRGFDSEQFAKKLMGQIVFLYFIQKKGWLGVNAFPVVLTERQYKDAFYRSGQKPKELMPKVYKPVGDGKYKRDTDALLALSDEDETTLSTLVKGDSWGDGPKDFMRQIFNAAEEYNRNFFDDYLEPLFYTGLNQNRGENAFFPPLHRRIPFLNGGLFEEMDGYDWRNNDFSIPNEIFSNVEKKGRDADGILDVFDRYNFTMAEDEPMEREVAIDPEMLGKVFENLLDVTDRKSKGAFYTPREIVHYMCQETIINYLSEKTKIDSEDIRKFVILGEYFRDDDTKKTLPVDNETGEVLIGDAVYSHKHHLEFDKQKDLEIPDTIFSYKKGINRLQEIDDLLANVKIVDLAVGSGAFPLGMLNEIVKARDTITSYMTIEMNGYQRLGYRSTRNAYRLKRDTIKNSIFACDIEASATDITKLRLWLSLVIDNQIMKESNEEFGYSTKPRELPNLDCNIICGNSLMDEFQGITLITENEILNNQSLNRQLTTFDQSLGVIINELIELQSRLYDEKDHIAKETLKNQIQDIYNKFVLEQIYSDSETVDEYYQAIQMASKPFVLWQIYFPKVFRDNGGFDIVIGNPPYIGESGHKEIFRPISKTQFGKRFYQGKMDYFYFFFNKGIDLLKPGGELALITTNYYPTASGAKKLRSDLKDRTIIRKFINFNEVKVFESALGQHNMITILSKKRDKEERIVNCVSVLCSGSYVATSNQLNRILTGEEDNLSISVTSQDNLYDGEELYIRFGGVCSEASGTVEAVLTKMSNMGKPLGNYAEVNQGVLTGCDTLTNRHLSKLPPDTDCVKNDGIFVLDFDVPRDVQEYEGFSEGKALLKDFYKNSDISRYFSSNKATKKLIYYNGELDSNKYPDVYEHMLKYRPILEERLVTYNEHYHWTAIHRPRNGKVFENGVPKIVVPYRTKTNSFAYNEIEWFCRSDCYVITSKNQGIRLKALLAMLNSDTYFCWLYNRGKRKGEVLELFQKPLSEIPIIVPDEEIQEKLERLAERITEMKKEDRGADTSEFEREINQIVYELFGFSEEEISMIHECWRDE
jgi:adenine-specific DNA-methyltransferase